MLAKVQKWEGPRAILPNIPFLAINLLFRARSRGPVKEIGTSKRVDFTGINRLAVRLQKVYFMRPHFCQHFKVQKVKSRY